MKRSTLVGAGAAIASSALPGMVFAIPEIKSSESPIDLAIARGFSPAKNAIVAVDALGGFKKFVREGDRVVIKPNPGGSAPPEMGINVHPDVIEAVIRECYRAGAADVRAVSKDKPRWIKENGILAAVERAGGSFGFLNKRSMYREVLIPKGKELKQDWLSKEVLDADVFINLPIMKHHSDTRVTGGLKNLMGITWDPYRYHLLDLDRCIAEATTAVPHSLVIMDANYVLMTNGPMGPGRVRHAKEVIACVDPVAADAAGMRYFRPRPKDIRHIRLAHEVGAGNMDLSRLRIKEISAEDIPAEQD